jgi:hypothetical protein
LWKNYLDDYWYVSAIIAFMEEIEGLIQQVSKVKDGFKPIQAEAENILAQYLTIGTAFLEALRESRGTDCERDKSVPGSFS